MPGMVLVAVASREGQVMGRTLERIQPCSLVITIRQRSCDEVSEDRSLRAHYQFLRHPFDSRRSDDSAPISMRSENASVQGLLSPEPGLKMNYTLT